MDNAMTAIISAIMMTLGFVSGLIVSDLLHTDYINRLHGTLNRATDKMIEKDEQIDDLKKQLEKEKDLNIELIKCLDAEKQKMSDILTSVRNVTAVYDECLPRVMDPPRGPLKRSRACMEDSESESEFEYPISPEPTVSSKD